MDVMRYIKPLLKWWWLVLLSVVVAAGATYFVSHRATPLYRTKTTLMIGNSIQNPDPSSSELYTGQELASTYVQMVMREPVLKATVDSLGWGINWEDLTSKISASIVPQSQLLEIYSIDSNPATAKLLADTVAQELINLSPSGTTNTNSEQRVFIKAQLSDLQQKINSGKQQLSDLSAELDAANSAQQIQDLQTQSNILETKISNWQSTYAQLLQSLSGGDVNALTIIEEASIPTKPFSPNIRMNVLMAAAIGLVLSVGGIILIEFLDDSLRVFDDTQSLVNLPTLAKIGQIRGKKEDSKLVAQENPLAPEVDNFRILRMNIQSISNWQSIPTILFTSAEPSVGKSVTASNLAIVMAQNGNRVILVEADLRKPSIHRLFGVSNERGLKDLLTKNDVNIIECLKSTKVDNLKILACGSDQIYSIEALGSERMKVIIKELTTMADIVLFDCSPALMFSDTFLLGKLVSGVIIMSRAGRTRTDLLKRVVSDLRLAGINILGVVVQHRSTNEGYGYKYYRYYSDSSSTIPASDFSANGHKTTNSQTRRQKNRTQFINSVLEKLGF